MSWWHSLLFRFRSLRGRTASDLERREELEFHLTLESERLEATGLSPSEARRRARATFGSVEAHCEELRDGRRFPLIENFWTDLGLAFRTLRRAPVFTAVIVLTLALGIAATGSIFSAAQEVLIRPLPYDEPGRLVILTSRHLQRDIYEANISYPDFLDWQKETRTFQGLGLYTGWAGTLSGDGLPSRLSGAAITPEVFGILGVEPELGRGFRPEETVMGQHRVVVLDHGVWTHRFGARPSLVGESITLDGEAYTVVGVMPPQFRFPFAAEAWVPMAPGEFHRHRGARFLLGAVGRMAEGITLDRAQTDLERVCTLLSAEYPDSNEGWDAAIEPLAAEVFGPLKPALLILQIAAGLVFLVVCGNVAGLLLARGLQRRHEMALRSALGAGRRRLVALLVAESFALAALGFLASIPLLIFGSNWLRNLLVDRFGVLSSLEPNFTVLAFTLGISLLATLIFGLLPAMRSARAEAGELTSRRVGSGRRSSQLRQAFVVAQLALVVVLLVGATLIVRSIYALDRVELGFDPEGILSARIDLPATAYPDAESRDAALEEILRGLRALPGVEAVAAAQGLPFSGWNVHQNYEVEGQAPPEPGREVGVHVQTVTSDFHALLGVELRRGRWLRPSDGDDAAVVLVNESFVRRHFENRDPLGTKLSFDGQEWLTIVGVLADYLHFELTSAMRPSVYLPWQEWSPRRAALAVRTSRDPSSLIPELRQSLGESAPQVPPHRLEPLTDAVARETFHARLVRDLLAGFAAVSVLLALIGLYGVVSYAVASRRRELGIRVALGATPAQVAGGILRKGVKLSGLGIALGLGAALASTGFLHAFLFEVQSHDPLIFGSIAALALVLSLIAIWIPARRASRQNPVDSIRIE